MSDWTRAPRLLEGVRVLELGDGTEGFCGKLLADLGATVEKAVAAGSRLSPAAQTYHDRRKRLHRVPLDGAAGRESLRRLSAEADVLLVAGIPAPGERFGLEALRAAAPRLVVATIAPFGSEGPRRAWRSCDLVAAASGGQLSVNGTRAGGPLKLPGTQALYLGALHAAIGILLALLRRQATGKGARVEVSLQEAVAAGLDHVLVRYFATGAAPARTGSRQWNDSSVLVPCRDGHAVVFPFLQWETLVEWMASDGAADDLRDARYRDAEARAAAFDRIVEAISRWTATRSRAELFETAQLMRLPWAPVATVEEVLESPQLRARGFFVPVGPRAALEPGPPYLFRRSPAGGALPRGKAETSPPDRGGADRRLPLHGLRVLDFTRVLAGPFATRLLADFGAEVLKVQTRKTAGGAEADDAPYFAMWNRNKRSVTVDLDRPEGRALVLELLRKCDAVVENFAPRVLENWDLGYEALRAANPDLVVLRMSAAGQTGPWRETVAFGPTIHALAGMTQLTGYAGGGPVGPGFAYSDVVAGLYGGLAAAAALYARGQGGGGCSIDLSQYEALVSVLGPALLAHQERPGERSLPAEVAELRPAAPHGCFPCRGEDRWCALAVFEEAQWRALCEELGLEEAVGDPRFAHLEARRSRSGELRALLAEKTASREAGELAERLQGRGVPAAPVEDARDLAGDAGLVRAGFFRPLPHPTLGEFTTDRGAIRVEGCEPSLAPAPLLGADTDSVCREVLGRSAERIAELRARGVLS